MRIKVNLEKVKCIKDTFGVGKDEMYLACFITCSDKLNNAKTIVKKDLTTITYKVTDGTVFEPVFNSSLSKDCIFDLDEIEISNAIITTTFVLYELDGGDHYQKINELSFEQDPDRPNINWLDLINKLGNAIIDKKEIPGTLYDIAKSVISYFRVDDLIDRFTKIYENIDVNGETHKNEIELNGCGGAYKAYFTTEFIK